VDWMFVELSECRRDMSDTHHNTLHLGLQPRLTLSVAVAWSILPVCYWAGRHDSPIPQACSPGVAVVPWRYCHDREALIDTPYLWPNVYSSSANCFSNFLRVSASKSDASNTRRTSTVSSSEPGMRDAHSSASSREFT
jgi:hypothetical protein